ncbi:hypothetical protein F4779DRAFT_525890 [Xylariaceae sp. FL0662B]|nr:hypothetical protein F4779DRAFT_525890 [Xylariaceae sp. FL0662B]
MGGQFTTHDPERCRHYARFAAGLSRIHFDVIYWSFFLTVIGTLFLSSWIYQWIMVYREKAGFCEYKFRKKLIFGIGFCTALFLLAAVLLVVEVFALLALQFCDGEDLMALYWSTWTMLQLGSEIAILGIVMALWHHLYDIRHPLWALALGTPVLVVAGFGHIIQLALRMFYKKAKARRNSRRASRNDIAMAPSTYGIEQGNERPKPQVEIRRLMYFTMDVGDDDRVRRWPSFVGMSDGKAVVQLATHSEALSGSNPRLTPASGSSGS